jgi:hypothetical protein
MAGAIYLSSDRIRDEWKEVCVKVKFILLITVAKTAK